MACSTSRLNLIPNTLRRLQMCLYHSYTPEPTQPIQGKSPKMVERAEDAFDVLESDQTVFAHGAAATPNTMLAAMTNVGKARKLKNIHVCHMHTEGPALYVQPDCEGIFRSTSFFMAANVRKAVAEGRADTLPIFLHEIPKLFYRKIICPDIAIIHVSPPDAHGYCSLGTSVDCVRAALLHSKTIIAQINPKMPRTFGDSSIHVSHIDIAFNVCDDLPLHGGTPPNEVETKIGKLIAENLVVDGATLQMGIGSIPDAVLSQLKNHKNLGIHSEMFANGVVELMESGAISNYNKNIYKGRTVGSFIVGTQKLYDYIDNNPAINMLRVDWVNQPSIVAQMPKMTAINSCIELDITGQVVSDSIGTRLYSGFGGQVDFIRGAGDCFDGEGKPIIAMPSTTKNGESKINIITKPGAGVVTSRAHVQYVVTEYGIASLFGKTLLQRAYELIKIAHPDHRERLEKESFERFKAMPSCA